MSKKKKKKKKLKKNLYCTNKKIFCSFKYVLIRSLRRRNPQYRCFIFLNIYHYTQSCQHVAQNSTRHYIAQYIYSNIVPSLFYSLRHCQPFCFACWQFWLYIYIYIYMMLTQWKSMRYTYVTLVMNVLITYMKNLDWYNVLRGVTFMFKIKLYEWTGHSVRRRRKRVTVYRFPYKTD